MQIDLKKKFYQKKAKSVHMCMEHYREFEEFKDKEDPWGTVDKARELIETIEPMKPMGLEDA
jgi:hypothetical protein